MRTLSSTKSRPLAAMRLFSMVVGLLVSAVVYYVLTRSLDLVAETPAIEASERTIAETMP